MCSRYTLKTPSSAIAAHFDLGAIPELPPRYNVAPTQSVAAVRATAGGRELVSLRWGLVPSWADDIKIGVRMLNARAETVATKPAFRAAYRKRRCLIAADGYFEWQAVGRRKQPYYFQLHDGAVFAFAGLWEQWQRDGTTIESCTIITTQANDLTPAIHDRMPVILDKHEAEVWLDPQVADPSALLRPYPAARMSCKAVNPIVNNSRHEGPACIEPAA